MYMFQVYMESIQKGRREKGKEKTERLEGQTRPPSIGSTTTASAYTRKPERRFTFLSPHRSLMQSSTSAMSPVATNTLHDVIVSVL